DGAVGASGASTGAAAVPAVAVAAAAPAPAAAAAAPAPAAPVGAGAPTAPAPATLAAAAETEQTVAEGAPGLPDDAAVREDEYNARSAVIAAARASTGAIAEVGRLKSPARAAARVVSAVKVTVEAAATLARRAE
ncbi:unnamed protein product, partial [Phaeothamnion confervicola]